MVQGLDNITTEDMKEIKKQFTYLEKIEKENKDTSYFPSLKLLEEKTKDKEILIKSLAFLIWLYQNTTNREKYGEYLYLDGVLNEFAQRFKCENIEELVENIKNGNFVFSANKYRLKK